MEVEEAERERRLLGQQLRQRGEGQPVQAAREVPAEVTLHLVRQPTLISMAESSRPTR